MATPAQLRAKVLRALRRHGHAGTLRRESPGAFDPATSTTGPGTTLELPALIVTTTEGMSQTVQTSASINQVLGGTLVRNGERLVYFYLDDGQAPEVGDTLGPVEGKTWRVKRLNAPVSYKDIAILHRAWIIH